MKQEDWTQSLRQRLADHEEAAPEGLWADIEDALNRQAKRPTLLVRLRRWAVAAAVVGFVAGSSYLLWPDLDHNQTATHIVALNPQQQPSAIEEERESPQQESEASGDEPMQEPLPASIERHKQKAERSTTALSEGSIAEEEAIAEEGSIVEERTIAEERTIVEEVTTAEEETIAEERTPVQEKSSVQDTPVQSPTPSHGKTSVPSHQRPVRSTSRATFQLYASNYSEDRMHSNEVLMSPQLAQKFTSTEDVSAARSSAPIYLSGYEERQHHRQPVSVGLTLSYRLADRLSLTTGAVYTWQSSEFINVLPATQIVTEQKLHYLGIPLSLRYQLWQHRRLSVYLAAGAQADFNVGSKLTTDGVGQSAPHDRCQWSAGGSLGVAYRLVPEISLYAEPGVKHYFDNGSQVANFFKDQPTSFSMQLGVRVHF